MIRISIVLFLIAAGRALTTATIPLSSGLIALGRPTWSIAASLTGNLALFPLLPLFVLAGGLQGAGWHAILQSALAAGMLLWFFHQAVHARAAGEASPG